MANPTTKQEFADWILRRLGAPIVNIEITDQQLEDVVDEAISYYYEWHHEGTQRSYRCLKLDTEILDGNNRPFQDLTADYYDPDKEYRVGDRVRATIDKDQGERIWIKFDSEDHSSAYQWIEYPAGDWFKKTGTDAYVFYDSDTSYIYVYDSDTRGGFVFENEVYTAYDSDQHAFTYFSIGTINTIADPALYYTLKTDPDSEYVRAVDSEIWNYAQYDQIIPAPPTDSEFKIILNDSEIIDVNTDLKKIYNIYGATHELTDSDGAGNNLPKLSVFNDREIEIQFRDSDIVVRTRIMDYNVISEVVEPLEYGLIRIENPLSEVYYRTNNIVDDDHIMYYTVTDSDKGDGNYHVGMSNTDFTADTKVTGVFVGPNPKWVLRDKDSEYSFDSDLMVNFNRGTSVITDSEIRNIPKLDSVSYETKLFINGTLQDSDRWGTTKFESLKDLAINYDSDSTFITLVTLNADGTINDSEVLYGSGYVNIIHPSIWSEDPPVNNPDSDVLHFWYGNYQNELDNNPNDSDTWYNQLDSDLSIPIFKNKIDTGKTASVNQTYWPNNYGINYNSSTTAWNIIDSTTTNDVDSDIATGTVTIPDYFQIVEDSEVMIALLDGTDITNNTDISIIWPTDTDSDINKHRLALFIDGDHYLDSDGDLGDLEKHYVYRTFPLNMRAIDSDADSEISIDFHGLYERSLKDPDLVLYDRVDSNVTRYERNAYLDGRRYIRLDQVLLKENMTFKDLWAL